MRGLRQLQSYTTSLGRKARLGETFAVATSHIVPTSRNRALSTTPFLQAQNVQPSKTPVLQSLRAEPLPPKLPIPRPGAFPGRTPAHGAGRPNSDGRRLLQSLITAVQEDGEVLLYKSPRHGSFYFFSYFCGGGLIIGAVVWADFAIKEKPGLKQQYWQRALATISCVMTVSMGTALILAPFNLIRSMTILRRGVIRMEIKRKLPFLKPDVLECTIDKLSLEKKLAATSIRYRTVPVEDAKAFTDLALQKPPRKGILRAISDFNSSLIHVWPSFKREVQRACARDQLAYVQVKGTGRFKLDLQDCLLLGGTHVLEDILPIANHEPWWRRFVGRTSGT